MEERNAYKFFRKVERKGAFGKRRHRWKDNMRIDFMEVICWMLFQCNHNAMIKFLFPELPLNVLLIATDYSAGD
jgi:hypothetical protein